MPEPVDHPCELHGLVRHHRYADGRLRCGSCVADYVRRNQRATKATLVMEHGGRCIRCGYSGCPGALHFHHRDPSNKLFKVGAGNRSLERQRAEAAKCDLICANCHAEEHWKP